MDVETPTAPEVVTTDAAAPQAPPPAGPKSVLVEDAAQPSTAPGGKDWSERIKDYAKNDDKVAKKLARYSSEKDALDALLAAQSKISQGLAKASLNDDPSDEELATWREANGIPAAPDAYSLTAPDGVEYTEEDEAMIGAVIQAAHGAHLTNAAAQEIASAYLTAQAEQRAQIAERDENNWVLARDQLKETWGGDYTLNANMVNNLLATAPAGLSDKLMGARSADGTPLAHEVDLMRWLATMAREINPAATVLPVGGGGVAGIEVELSKIQALMGDYDSAYWKGPESKTMQARYETLLTARDKTKR